jgi:tRNA 2-thiouridine synthesizing protein E
LSELVLKNVLHIDDRSVELDADGFLRRCGDWDEDVARAMARHDAVELTPQHWEIIHYVRAYYAEYALVPIMRVLAKAIARDLGPDKASSRYLYRLFKQGPVRQASRYGGLPKPPSCI